MKCKYCNSNIQEGDLFCGNCGKKIKKENEFTKWLKKHESSIYIGVSVILLLVIVIELLLKGTNPTTVATKYMNSIKNNDIEAIYSNFDVEESDFVNLDTLNKKIEKLDNISNMEIVDKKINENDALITYKYWINDKSYIAYVSLTKSGKKYLLFDNWKINSGKISKNITINAPTGSTISIDDIDLSKYKTGEDNYDTYNIDAMITGKYNVKIKLLDGTEIEDEINISDNSTYSLGNFELIEESKTAITDMSKTFIEQFYNGIINDTNVDELNYNDQIKNNYRNLKYNYKISNMKLTSFNISDIVLSDTTYINGSLVAYLTVEYNYNMNYLVNDENNSYSGTNRKTVSLIFNYSDGYQIEDIGNLNLSFPIRK